MFTINGIYKGHEGYLLRILRVCFAHGRTFSIIPSQVLITNVSFVRKKKIAHNSQDIIIIKNYNMQRESYSFRSLVLHIVPQRDELD